jgi:hypothetical protein
MHSSVGSVHMTWGGAELVGSWGAGKSGSVPLFASGFKLTLGFMVVIEVATIPSASSAPIFKSSLEFTLTRFSEGGWDLVWRQGFISGN